MTDVWQQPEDEDAPRPEISEAWGPLWAWACAQRPDWESPDIKGAMRAADSRGVPYETAARILWRLAWTLDAGTRDVLAELTDVNRVRPHTGADVYARGAELAREALARARVTGEQPVLGPDGHPSGQPS